MPQEFQVLCCYCCHMYQVHQLKKSNKWNCKVCNEKQSVKQIYGKGSGKECREHVQKLNALIGLKDSLKFEEGLDVEQCSYPVDDNLFSSLHNVVMSDNPTSSTFEVNGPNIHKNSSKWSSFLDKTDSEDTDDNEQDLTSIVRRKKNNSIVPNKKLKRLEGETDTINK